jgi:hypothetical protein
MDTNPYATPSSPVEIESKNSPQRFYVVSPIKFLALFFTTFGVYHIFWHYKNWALYKKATRGDEWPIMRAIFFIFFTHSLFREIDKELIMTSNKHKWSPELCATVIIILSITARIYSRISSMGSNDETSIMDVIILLYVPITGYFLYQAQKAINQACADPVGETNSSFTVANIIWMALGAIFVFVIFLGSLAILFPDIS